MINVKVLGVGCPKCNKLYELVEQTAANNNIEIQLEKKSDMNKILGYGVMMMPGLVIDGEVKCSGKIPKPDDLKLMLNKSRS